MFGRRILAVAPHPDDEAVGVAIAIRRAQAQGATVLVLDLTHGCPPASAYPARRRARHAERVARRREEAMAAARLLNVARIADEGLAARELRRHLGAVHERLARSVAGHEIDALWVPAFEGGHPDHDCANAVAAALGRARPGLAVWEFAEYNFAGGRARSNSFIRPEGETVLTLTAEEARFKRDLLALYASERGNLGAIETTRECLRPLPRHDYAAPPHPGRLWYERFHWVPFRHPRIDRTTGTETAAAIAAFFAEQGIATGGA